jgi:hypothetical protein
MKLFEDTNLFYSVVQNKFEILVLAFTELLK